MHTLAKQIVAAILLITFLPAAVNTTEACTRVVYKGPNNTVITARSMDFSMEIPANLWLFPKGMEHTGNV